MKQRNILDLLEQIFLYWERIEKNKKNILIIND